MKSKIKLSIIMTAYNEEKYLEKALNSLASFLTKEVEAIIINDASTDSSNRIIERFIKSNKRKNIIYINNPKNLGAGKSKNKGLEKATGEYIGFLDADDYVDKNFYGEMVKLADRQKADIVVSDIVLDYGKRKVEKTIYTDNLYSEDDNGIELAKNTLYGYWACVSTCSKIFRRETIKDIRFSETKVDDLMFTVPAIEKAKKIIYCRNKKYYYYQSPNSLTRNDNLAKNIDGVNALFEVVNYLEKNGKKESAKIFTANSQIPFFLNALSSKSNRTNRKTLSHIKRCLKKYKFDLNEMITENKYLEKTELYKDEKNKVILNYLVNRQYKQILKIVNRRERKGKIFTAYRLLKSNKDKFRYIFLSKIFRKHNFNPLVSIVIPVYNGENYLKKAIDSALAQTYKNIEIIVVNDGSKDNTEKIALSYGDKIRYIKQENGGVAAALNTAIKNMKGEYFSWLSHDDLYFDYKVEKQIDYLNYQKNKDIVLFSNYMLIDEDGKQMGEPIVINHKTTKKQEYCLLRGCVNGITLLIPKKAFDTTGEFNTDLRCTQDYDMWHRMLKNYKFVHMDEVLSKTRIHAGQDTNKNPRAVTEGDDLWMMMIEDVQDERKVELEGSLYNYYSRMLKHLKFAPYEKTKKFCLDKCMELDEKKAKEEFQ